MGYAKRRIYRPGWKNVLQSKIHARGNSPISLSWKACEPNRCPDGDANHAE
jgi:hypothetical protein